MSGGREAVSFLGRLARADSDRIPLADSADAAIVTALIVRNLGFILNTKKTHGSVLVDYGLGDYDDPTRIKGDVDLLAREIQATVAVYEPRISGPQVKAVARDPRRRIDYELTGTVAGEPRTIRIAFDARSRTVTVKEA